MIEPIRKICVVTGTRAEYGLLSGLMREINADPALALQVVVTAMHLDAAFGGTAAEIENDGFSIDARVPIDLSDDSPLAVARSLAQGIAGIAEALDRLAPHILVVLGDRYEILAAAEAAMLLRIPIAHIHGGEATEGLIDEPIRHSVTKMSHLHFTAAEVYRRRVIQLGEQPSRVFNVGALCLDVIASLTLMDISTLSESLDFDLSGPFFLVTYHPVTLSADDPAERVTQLLDALERFPDYKAIITGVNSDPGNRAVAREIMERTAAARDRFHAVASLGQVKYLSAMKFAAAVVGNSSSGLLEAPALKVPTINIGERQRGRVRAASVVDCAETADAIATAISSVLMPAHAERTQAAVYPFGSPGASRSIKRTLKSVDLGDVLMKPFYDLPMAVQV